MENQIEETQIVEARKRVDIVSLKVCKESSILYEPRKISSPLDALELCKNFLENLDREQMIAISLNTKNEPTNVSVVSGDVKPSKEDISITKRLKEVGEIIGINLIDHIIIGSKDRYTSLKEMDIL